MKKTTKLMTTIFTVGLSLLITLSTHHSVDVLGQLNQAKDLTSGNYHVEIAVLVWLLCAIINSVIWLKKEKKVSIKKIDFDFLNSEKEMGHEK